MTTKKVLFLDDSPERHKVFRKNTIGVSVDWAKTADECIAFLSENEYDDVFLDHDLEDEHYVVRGYGEYGAGTGMDVVRWLADNAGEKFGKTLFFVHSLNASRAPIMAEELRKAGLKTLYFPFAWEKIRYSVKAECLNDDLTDPALD